MLIINNNSDDDDDGGKFHKFNILNKLLVI